MANTQTSPQHAGNDKTKQAGEKQGAFPAPMPPAKTAAMGGPVDAAQTSAPDTGTVKKVYGKAEIKAVIGEVFATQPEIDKLEADLAVLVAKRAEGIGRLREALGGKSTFDFGGARWQIRKRVTKPEDGAEPVTSWHIARQVIDSY